MTLRKCLVFAVLFVLVVPVDASAERRRRGLRVQILSSPPGATVTIDGEEQRSTTPVWVDLRRGTHQLSLTLDGHAPLEEELEVTRAWARFNFSLTAMGRLVLQPSNDSADGATVSVDGEEAGTIPFSQALLPGRHSVRVEREGFHPVTRWFEISGGQTYASDVSLRPLPPPTGEVLIAADVSDATVYIDGEPSGSVPTIIELPPGEHAVEVRAEGFETFIQTVNVESGARATVTATLQPEQPPGGTLLVMTVPAGATVSVDGQARGEGPATVEALPPGTHIVEVEAEGYLPANERVEVEEGRQATIRVQLEAIPQGGSLRITSSVENAEVLLDGRTIGRAPLVERDIEPGEHVVVVRAPGHREWERRLEIEAGVQLLVEATPDSVGAVTVTADVEDAVVWIDGTEVGPAPLNNHELATGDHTIEIRAEGRQSFTTSVTVNTGAVDTVNAQLAESAAAATEGGEAPAPAAQRWQPDRSGPRYTRSGFPVPPRSFYIDASWGWPWLIGNYRLGTGIWDGVDWGRMGIALEVRSSYWLTEIDFRLQFGFRFARIVRIGTELGLGAAIGAAYGETTDEHRAGFILNFTLTEGLEIRPVAFGLSQRLEFFVDTHGEVGNEGLVRQIYARVFVGAFVEVKLHRMVHVFLLADYAPAQDERRSLCADAWDSDDNVCTHDSIRDINLSVQAGVGLRFF